MRPVSPSASEPSNQTPPFADMNLVALDRPLLDALAAAGIDPIRHGLLSFGEEWGAAGRLDLGRQANENPPQLKTHDPQGRRLDIVEFHPAWHALMHASMAGGLHASTWNSHNWASSHSTPTGTDEGNGAQAHAARAARLYVTAQVESGHVCPLTMTHAAIAALSAAPERLADWLPLVRSRRYDPRFLPFWEKHGVTLGMGLTEKQGGSDVRANITRAIRTGGDDYEITGQKWFMSAPMSDGFLVLAQAQGGLTCFLMPRFRPDGTINALHFQRLKDKLGNRSNASSEVEFASAFAWRIGDEGRGVRTIIDMVQLTRLDCAVASAGLIRMGTALAVHHAHHRRAFGKPLVDQPAMRRVLADLALESEAATALAIRLAASFDRAKADPQTAAHAAAHARMITPAAKFTICRAAPALIYEAMECLGGNAYVEESPMPRLFREAPVNAIWEGTGSIMALDVLRAAAREPDAAATVLVTLSEATHGLPGAAEAVADIETALRAPDAEAQARFVTERLAQLAALAALKASAPPEVAEVYALTRVAAPRRAIGANNLGAAERLLIERALPGL